MLLKKQSGMRVALGIQGFRDFGLRIADCGLRIADCQVTWNGQEDHWKEQRSHAV